MPHFNSHSSRRYLQLLKSTFLITLMATLMLWTSCEYSAKGTNSKNSPLNVTNELYSKTTHVSISPTDTTLQQRVSPPPRYVRDATGQGTFLHYSRQLALKAHGAKVLLYNSQEKANQQVHVAVLDQYIGERDLHQCADAAIRIKADYLRSVGRTGNIEFQLTNGHRVAYSKWRQGNRILIDGNKTKWVKSVAASDSDDNYWQYLELIFMYAGTASLAAELTRTSTTEPEAGDLLLKGGYPGHAVLIIDEAVHTTTGEKLYLLAQSYMPAQEMHILKNPSDKALSPWYRLSPNGGVQTPEWGFEHNQLYKFID